MQTNRLANLIGRRFEKSHIKSALRHYEKTVEEYQLSEWENCIAKGGKFTEAVLKALWICVGETVPVGKLFKVDTVITGLSNKPATVDDTIRLTIPRAARLVYDVASNRGGRHDPSEIDPNQMDAALVVSTCSWVLAELLRYSQKRTLNSAEVAELIASLNERKYAFAEDIDGRIYFSFKGLSARDVILLTLWKIHPRRMSRNDLIDTAKRHGNSRANASLGVSRLSKVTDDDGAGNLRLLNRGTQEAEALIKTKAASQAQSW